jgi:hypothetical protein
VAYTTVAAVQARAGRLLDDLTANPSQAEVEDEFMVQVDATLNGYLAGAGLTVPATDEVVLGALSSTATDGVLVLALEARFQQDADLAVLDGARSRWKDALKAMADGCHPALIAAQEAVSGVGGSFATDEADSYLPAALDPYRTEPFNRNTEPEVYEGMPL